MIDMKAMRTEAALEDPDVLLARLKGRIDRGEHDTYLEALAAEIEILDLDYDEALKKLVSRTLREIILEEARGLKLLRKSEDISSLAGFLKEGE